MITGLRRGAFISLRESKSNKRTKKTNSGFTVAELMVVLAVSSLLLISALNFVSGQQNRTEFSQSINDIRQQIVDVINNVANGYYTNPGNFVCQATATSTTYQQPAISAGANQQGSNAGCVFVGRAMEFGVDGNPSRFNIYSLIGRQYIPGTTNDVTSLDEARPVAFADGDPIDHPFPPDVSDPTEEKSLGFDLTAVRMTYDSNDTSTFVIMTDFTTRGATAGSRNDLLFGLDQTNLDTRNTKNDAVKALDFFTPPASQRYVKANAVTICFKSGSDNKYGVIHIGTNNSQLNTTVNIYDDLASVPAGDCIS